MKDEIYYNEKYILITDSKEKYDDFKYSFKNIMYLKNNFKKRDLEKIKRNNYKILIFLDYNEMFLQFINTLNRKYIIKVLYTKDLGTLSKSENFESFMKVIDLYEEKIVSEIGFIDYNLYETYKDKINCKHVIIDRKIENKKKFHTKNIGIINNQENVYHSYYNSLSAVEMTDKTVCTKNINKVTSKFMKIFNIKHIDEKKDEENFLNLYVNFSDNNNIKILESMDNDMPCIVGNTRLFEKNKYLEEKLVLKSDDDINEIKDKIEDVFKCKDKIINEYKKFRKDYAAQSKNSVLNFTEDFELDKKKDKEENDILISVIVPVYNCEKYLSSCIDSIIKARIRKMEIIVINDGSTDNSEEVILKYVKKYPKLIRYIKKKNEGIGITRTIGLKNAKGKYISAIDSDDMIDRRFYKDAVKYLLDDIDLVLYDWETCTKDSKYITPALEAYFINKNIYEGIMYSTIMASQCNKIIKKSIYEHLNLNYGEGKYEDFATNGIALLAVKKFKYIRRPYYKYQIRKGSIMRSNPGVAMIDAIKLLSDRLITYDKYNNLPKDEYKYYLFSWRIEEYIINVLYDLEEIERNKMIDYMYKKIANVVLETIENPYYKETLEKLTIDKKEYLIERNKCIKNGKLKSFISKRIKEKTYKKVIPEEMFYM